MMGQGRLVLDGWKSPSERQRDVQDWNDTIKKPPRVLIASSQIATSGVDLHRHCSVAIFNYMPWNAGTIELGMGRFHRIGQSERVRVHILKAPGTFMDYQEKSLLDKWVPVCAIDMQHSTHLEGIAFIMFCYEVIRERWGQSFNRFAWTMLHKDSGDGKVPDPKMFNDTITVFVGLLISSVVRYVLSLPVEEANEFSERLMKAGVILRKVAEDMLDQVPDNHREEPLLYYQKVSHFDRDWGRMFEKGLQGSVDTQTGGFEEEQALRRIHERFVERMNNPEDYNEVDNGETDSEGEDEGGDEDDATGDAEEQAEGYEIVNEGGHLDSEGDVTMNG